MSSNVCLVPIGCDGSANAVPLSRFVCAGHARTCFSKWALCGEATHPEDDSSFRLYHSFHDGNVLGMLLEHRHCGVQHLLHSLMEFFLPGVPFLHRFHDFLHNQNTGMMHTSLTLTRACTCHGAGQACTVCRRDGPRRQYNAYSHTPARLHLPSILCLCCVSHVGDLCPMQKNVVCKTVYRLTESLSTVHRSQVQTCTQPFVSERANCCISRTPKGHRPQRSSFRFC